MQQLFQYDIPLWHPVAVHFPPALLVASVGVAALWLVRGTPQWRRCLLFLLLLGAAGTLLAYQTGEAMYAQSQGVPMVELFIDLHESVALYALWAAAGALAVVGALSIWLERRELTERPPAADEPTPLREPLTARATGLLATLLAALLVAYTAHIGGVMVWGVPG